MELKELNNSIYRGLRLAYEDSLKFKGFINPKIKPEYLITVNVAQSISSDFDLVLKLEESTRILKNESGNKLNIIDHFKYLQQFKKLINLREGRIDIALYEDNPRAVYPIEVKGFDTPAKNKKRLYADINRLLLFMKDNSGHNDIKFSTVIFIQEIKAALKSEIAKKILDIERKYSELIKNEYNDKLEDFKFEINAEIVFDNLFKADDEIDSYSAYSTIDKLGLNEAVDEVGFYVGVIINTYRKKRNIDLT